MCPTFRIFQSAAAHRSIRGGGDSHLLRDDDAQDRATWVDRVLSDLKPYDAGVLDEFSAAVVDSIVHGDPVRLPRLPAVV